MKASITKSFARECFLGIHDLSSDTLKIACFVGADAPINSDTTEYDIYFETSGPGYTSGGQVISIPDGYPMLEGPFMGIRFDDIIWPGPATFSYRKALIYNATKGNRSIMAIDFGLDKGPLNSSHKISTPASAPPPLTLSFGL